MNNYSQIENKFLHSGYVIKKAEKNSALNYIRDFIKKRIIQESNLKRRNIKNFSFNALHNFVSIKDLNRIRLKLYNDINKDINSAIDYYLDFLEKYETTIFYEDVRLRLREIAG